MGWPSLPSEQRTAVARTTAAKGIMNIFTQTSERHVVVVEQSDMSTRRVDDDQRQGPAASSFHVPPPVPPVVGFPFAPPFMLPAYRRPRMFRRFTPCS